MLKSREPIGTLELFQLGSVSKTDVMPSGGDYRCGIAAILGPQQAEARGPYSLLIETRRDQQEITRGGTNVEFALGDRSGDHCRICEHQTSALPQHTGPLNQSPEAIPEVRDRVNAEDGIEGAILERQTGVAVKEDKAGTIRQAAGGRLGIGVRDSIRLDIEARQPTSGLLNQCKRGQTTSTGNVEDVAILPKAEKIGNLGLFGNGPPALLTDVLIIDFSSDFSRQIGVKSAILRGVEIRHARHDPFLSRSEVTSKSYSTSFWHSRTMKKEPYLPRGAFSPRTLRCCRIPQDFLSDLGSQMSDQETKSERRLAAIMVTDIAGYSSLMQSDEAGTFVALGTMRGAAEKLVRQHRGRIANLHPGGGLPTSSPLPLALRQRCRAAGPIFSVVPQRLPAISPCGVRRERGTPNAFQTSRPPPFSR